MWVGGCRGCSGPEGRLSVVDKNSNVVVVRSRTRPVAVSDGGQRAPSVCSGNDAQREELPVRVEENPVRGKTRRSVQRFKEVVGIHKTRVEGDTLSVGSGRALLETGA